MQRQGDEVHMETDEARAGESRGAVRWILGISLFAAIILLSAIWIFGAFTQDDVESQATVTGTIQAAEDDGSDTDSIVSEDADNIEGAAGDEVAGRIQN